MRERINDPARIGLMLEAIEGLRHVLVHDYYTVNTETIWAIIENDIPGSFARGVMLNRRIIEALCPRSANHPFCSTVRTKPEFIIIALSFKLRG